MIKNLMIFLFLIFATNSFSKPLSEEWFFSSEEKKSENSTYDLDLGLESIFASKANSLDHINNESQWWKLDQVKTILGLTLKGELGLKAWGGRSAIELIWKKRTTGQKDEPLQKSNIETIDFSGLSKLADFKGAIIPYINYLVKNEQITNSEKLKTELLKKIEIFYQVAQGLDSSDGKGWRPSKLRLDLSISAEGSVDGIITKAGGDIRLRFEFTKKTSKMNSNENGNSIIAHNSKKFIELMSREIALAEKAEINSGHLKLKEYRVGVGVGIEGNVGIAKSSASFFPQVFFKKVDLANKEISDAEQLVDVISNDSKQDKINSKRIRKGIRKSIRFAEFFQKKLANEKYQDFSWAVHTIKPRFDFDLSGDVGLVTLKGLGILELIYENMYF